MRSLLAIFFLLVLVSCSTTRVEKESLDFMSKDDVMVEMKALVEAKEMADEPLSQEEQSRLDDRTNDVNEFFSKEDLAKLKAFNEQKSFEVKSIQDAPVKPEVDLRYRSTPVKAQDNGKCTAYAGIGALENTLNRGGDLKGLNLSEWHIWSKYRKYSCSAFIDAIKKYKVCDEKYYKQYGKKSSSCEKKAHAMITDVTYIGNSAQKAVEALNRGNVVYLGMSTPKDVVRCRKVVSPKTPASSGGHAMLLEGYYLDKNVPGGVVFITRNSWGSNCADEGYHYMPGNLFTKSGYYAIMWEIKQAVSSSDYVPTPEPKPKWKKIYKRLSWPPKCWFRKCPVWVKVK